MKKFFAAVCVCGLAAFNVSAQEPVAETTVIAPAVQPVAQDAVAPVATPVAEAPVVVEGGSVIEGGVIAQTYSGAAAPVYGAAPVQSGCGCGQSAPVYNAAPVQSDCGCGSAAPACAAPADPCCEARPKLFSRVRGRAGKRGNRGNSDNCCCCN